MTKTYNDIEAVTRLLEEKEKDLELTARIGKELLTANGRLEARVTALEGELRSARDHITQLRHDLNAKTDLLQVLTNDTEECSSPEEQEAANAALLRKRTGALERENRALREEAARLAAGADTAELAERQLLRDIANQLASANSEASALGSELVEERQRSADLQHQLDNINARLIVSERNYQQCASRWSTQSGPSLPGSDVADGPSSGTAFMRPPVKPSSDSFLDDTSDTDSDDLYPGGPGVGVPGAPGAAELAAALRRLTPQEINSRRASLTASHVLRQRRYTERDSSEESAVWGAGAGGMARFRPPHKLQIVKPMEGSLTLHTWAQLAKPSMSGLLEEQEGVGIRGSRSSGLGTRLYRLSDVEEDDDMPRLPHSSHIYTFVNSTVLHPNDGSVADSTASSVCSSGMSSLASSVLGSAWSSRRTSAGGSPVHSRRDSVCLPPSRAHFTPTATPANSPLLGSPDSTPPASPRPGDAPPSLHALIASGTSILRRRHLASPGGDGSPAPIALQTPGSLYTGLMHRSPMEQLTCLKRTLRSPAAPSSERRLGEPVEPPLGVPAHPGSGALDAASTPGAPGCLRRAPRARAPRPRSDLGTVGSSVPAPAPTAPAHSSQSSALGTLSLLFGRKGGLL
ncbi:hypothetical protein HF086_009384 [Spodoptera exigua]|uniref:Trafficking kinesin-binding protein milt n=1 Tax=Spodoptera exigua TaxID=7107 RepID=A0A922MJN0_SPOEX|nr:hypothetical protein HF086_009384 [Spodoptera exigua]